MNICDKCEEMVEETMKVQEEYFTQNLCRECYEHGTK